MERSNFPNAWGAAMMNEQRCASLRSEDMLQIG